MVLFYPSRALLTAMQRPSFNNRALRLKRAYRGYRLKTEIIALIDRSGSMATIAKDAVGGFNTFLADQKAVPGEGRMTAILFDHEYTPLYTGKPLSSAEPLSSTTYVPRGGTALLDALGRMLNEQGARIKSDGWADKVIVCILTDGQENQSREFTDEKIKTMVKHAEGHGWSFIYLAANVDAFATGAAYGINPGSTFAFQASAAGTAGAYQTMSNATRTLRSNP